jgi:hypothetical protein
LKKYYFEALQKKTAAQINMCEQTPWRKFSFRNLMRSKQSLLKHFFVKLFVENGRTFS